MDSSPKIHTFEINFNIILPCTPPHPKRSPPFRPPTDFILLRLLIVILSGEMMKCGAPRNTFFLQHRDLPSISGLFSNNLNTFFFTQNEKSSFQIGGRCTISYLYVDVLLPQRPTPTWRTTPYWPSKTA